MPTNFYCYADESGQDTEGRLFIVAVVLVDADRDLARSFCELAERESGKGKKKWTGAKFEYKLNYIGQVIHYPGFKGRLFFAVYKDTKRYQNATVQTISKVIKTLPAESGKVGVFIDALPKSLEQAVIVELRRSGANVEKVRGLAKDENESLIRLADSLCGLVRGAVDGDPDLQELLDWGMRTGAICDLTH
jgi:hypothetical protein